MVVKLVVSFFAFVLPAVAMAGAAKTETTPGSITSVQSAQFKVGNVDFEVPIPEGYCEPTGPWQAAADIGAAGDTVNITHLTLYGCNKDGSILSADRYILIKTPKNVVNALVNRKTLLASVGKEFKSTKFNEFLSSGEADKIANGGAAKALGFDVDLKAAIKPLGSDDFCAYLGGVGTGRTANKTTYEFRTGVCLTSVSDKVMSINYYEIDEQRTGVLELLKKSRNFASTVTKASQKTDDTKN